MQVPLRQVEHVPAQADQFGDAQAVAIGEQGSWWRRAAHSGRAVTGGDHQPLDLGGGEVLAQRWRAAAVGAFARLRTRLACKFHCYLDPKSQRLNEPFPYRPRVIART